MLLEQKVKEIIKKEYDYLKKQVPWDGMFDRVSKQIVDTIKSEIMIKASGGIKSLRQVKKVLAAGANRIGTSSGIIIMEEISLD